MKLILYIGDRIIESVNLDATRISKPGYLGQFKRTLKLKYKEVIREENEKTNFLVVATPGGITKNEKKPLVLSDKKWDN